MGTTLHKDLTGTDLHEPKAHVSSHSLGGSDALSHNSLKDLLGGLSNEYYHLSLAQYNTVDSLGNVDTTFLKLDQSTPQTVAGSLTLSGNNGNNTFTLLNLNNNDTPSTEEVGQTSDLVFNLTQSKNSVASLHEAAKISAYKVSDWFHVSSESDVNSGLNFYTTNNGTSGLKLRITDTDVDILPKNTGDVTLFKDEEGSLGRSLYVYHHVDDDPPSGYLKIYGHAGTVNSVIEAQYSLYFNAGYNKDINFDHYCWVKSINFGSSNAGGIGPNPTLKLWGFLTNGNSAKSFSTQISDVDDYVHLSSSNLSYLLGLKIDMPLIVSHDTKALSFTIGANTLTTSEFGYLDGQDQAVKTISDVLFNNIEINKLFVFDSEYNNGNINLSTTINWNNGNKQKLTLNNTGSINFIAPSGVGNFQLKLIQDGSGNHTVEWVSGMTIKWLGGVEPILSTAANAEDIISFYYDGSSYYGVASCNFSVAS